MDMVLIPAGKFQMGSPDTEDAHGENEAQVDVTITQPFYLGRTEVTEAQWRWVMGEPPELSDTVFAFYRPITDHAELGRRHEILQELDRKGKENKRPVSLADRSGVNTPAVEERREICCFGDDV